MGEEPWHHQERGVQRKAHLTPQRVIVERIRDGDGGTKPRTTKTMAARNGCCGPVGRFISPYPRFGTVTASRRAPRPSPSSQTAAPPPFPDGARIGRLMRRYIYAVVSQGVMQVAIIVVMARFVTGL